MAVAEWERERAEVRGRDPPIARGSGNL